MITINELNDNSIGKIIEFISPTGVLKPYEILKVFEPPYNYYIYKVADIEWDYEILLEAKCLTTEKIESVNRAELMFANWKTK